MSTQNVEDEGHVIDGMPVLVNLGEHVLHNGETLRLEWTYEHEGAKPIVVRVYVAGKEL